MEFINGYQCKNCTDIDYAKKFIDPAHPKDGPFGVDSTEKVEARKAKAEALLNPSAVNPADPAVKFGGALAGFQDISSQTALATPRQQVQQKGGLVDISA